MSVTTDDSGWLMIPGRKSSVGRDGHLLAWDATADGGHGAPVWAPPAKAGPLWITKFKKVIGNKLVAWQTGIKTNVVGDGSEISPHSTGMFNLASDGIYSATLYVNGGWNVTPGGVSFLLGPLGEVHSLPPSFSNDSYVQDRRSWGPDHIAAGVGAFTADVSWVSAAVAANDAFAELTITRWA